MLAILALAAVAIHVDGQATAAVAATTTLSPDEDAYVSSATPTTNYGRLTSLRVDASPTTHSFLRFNISGAGSIGNATLKIYANSSQSTGYEVHGVADSSWGETTLTYSNEPAFAPAAAGKSGGAKAGSWTSVDVTSLMTGGAQVSLMLLTTNSTALSLASRESASPPQLVVTPSTIPGPTPTPIPTPTPTPGQTGSATLIAAGDIACDPQSSAYHGGLGTTSACQQKATSDLIASSNPDAVLLLGDNQYECGELSAFQASYDPSWGRFKGVTHPSVGNHEYVTSATDAKCHSSATGAPGYYQYFGQASSPLDTNCTVNCRGYYSFDVGAWHVISLNVQCSRVGGCGVNSPEEVWLRNDLATHPNLCTLAYWHQPVFSSGGRASANAVKFWNDLYGAGADVVLTGHDHIYERFAPQGTASGVNSAQPDSARGIREFIAGTGGADHTSITSVAPYSEVRDTTSFGVLKLSLLPSGYHWQFLPDAQSGNGKFTDTGDGVCH